jgi:hemolysin D
MPRAAQDLIPFRPAQARRSEELAFLPAALEIMETPPSPVGRKIAAAIVLLFCAALVWAWWGTIDIVASATGKIVPSGRSKLIQPFETSVVRAIRVHDGQAVRAGDVLIELDPTMNAAERDHLRSDLLAERLNIARLRAALANRDNPAGDFTPPADADPVLTVPSVSCCSISDRASPRSPHSRVSRRRSRTNRSAGYDPQLEAMIPWSSNASISARR